MVSSGDAQNDFGLDIERMPSDTVWLPGERDAAKWQEIMPKGLEVLDIYTEKWRNYDLDVVYLRDARAKSNQFLRSVFIPLKPNPVRVSVKSRGTRKAESEAVLKAILASLDANGDLPDAKATRENWTRTFVYIILGFLLALVAVWSVAGPNRGRT